MQRYKYPITLIIAIGFVAIILSAIGKTGIMSGDWSYITNKYINALPYIIGIGLGILWLVKRR